MARRSPLLLCWPPGPGRPLGGSVLPGECSHRLLCGAGHPADAEKVSLPEAQVSRAPEIPLSRPPPPQEPLQLQLLPISRASETRAL